MYNTKKTQSETINKRTLRFLVFFHTPPITGIPPSKLREIEVEALKEKEQKNRKETALRKIIHYWFENNPKANYEKFLIILSSEQEYLPSTEQHYTPQEMIGKDTSSAQQMRGTLEKLYPSFASRARTVEEAPADRGKWLDIDNWIKKRQLCKWSELVDKLDANGLDSGLLRNFLFETAGKTLHSLNNSIIHNVSLNCHFTR